MVKKINFFSEELYVLIQLYLSMTRCNWVSRYLKERIIRWSVVEWIIVILYAIVIVLYIGKNTYIEKKYRTKLVA